MLTRKSNREAASAKGRTSMKACTVISIVAVVMVFSVVACGSQAKNPAQAPPSLYDGPGDYVRGIESGGTMRWFKVHIPEGYEPGVPLPLVLSYHGSGSNFDQQALLSGFSVKADEEGFIAVYPQGSGWQAIWQIPEPVEINFTRNLLDHLERHLSIDPARIYATGFSNGGGMVDRLACDLSDRIAAVGPVAGTYLYWEPCEPQRPVPVAFFHGTADLLAPYVKRIGGATYTVPDWAQAWAERNGCDPTPVADFQEGAVYGETWSGCNQDAEVKLFAVKGGGHIWPGSRYGMSIQYADASALMWDFFQAHPMPPDKVRPTAEASSQDPDPLHARVDIGGYWLYITCQGDKRGQDVPTVILESAAGIEANEGLWETLPGRIAEFTRVCTYDRAGIGWSDPSPIYPRTAQVVADELHTLLHNFGETAPVIIVAHSLGGLFSRLYATTYPQDVAGLVLLDTAHEDFMEAFEEGIGGEYTYVQGSDIEPGLDMALSQAELDAVHEGQEAPLGALPLVVIARGQQAPNPDLTAEDLQERLERWQEIQADLATLSTNGTFLVAKESGHFIHLYQPDLVVDVIRQMIESR
jgi:polyhydroxybutyrate depolymerase